MRRYDFDKFASTIWKMVEEAEEKMKKTDKTIDEILNDDNVDFPVKKDTWYTYKSFISPGASKKVKSIKIGTLYDFCQYTNVSADYLLGLNDCRVKEASAQQIKKDFGLSDEALQCLSKMNERIILPNNQYSEKNFIDFLIVNFASRFLNSILVYFNKLDELDKFKKEYLDDKGRIKEEYLLDEESLIKEYQELEDGIDYEKFSIMQQIDRFITSFKKEFTSQEDLQQ